MGYALPQALQGKWEQERLVSANGPNSDGLQPTSDGLQPNREWK